jgi:hypothetical protein
MRRREFIAGLGGAALGMFFITAIALSVNLARQKESIGAR